MQDKWQVSGRLTLNVGVRYDWQELTERTKDAIGPRVGVAYNLTGNGKTLIRGGFGKVYQYQQLAVLQTLMQRSVFAPTLAYDTTQVHLAGDHRHVPGRAECRTRRPASIP